MPRFTSSLVLHLTRSERVMLKKFARESDPILATRARALLSIANGEPRKQTAQDAGVSHVTLYNWLRQFINRRQQGHSVRASLAASTARVIGGDGPILRLLLQANKAAKGWTIEEIKAFYRQRGIEISTGSAWNYKQALTEQESYPPQAGARAQSLAAAARAHGLKEATVYHRIRSGWSKERALSTPLLPGGRPRKRTEAHPSAPTPLGKEETHRELP